MVNLALIELVIKDAVSMAKYIIPKKTGNLRYNSFKLERIDEKTWRVYIDLEIAPYAVYVNGKWVSPVWGGKKNPNEGFWKKVFEFIANHIAKALNGRVITEVNNNGNNVDQTNTRAAGAETGE